MLTLRKTWWIGCLVLLSGCFLHARRPDSVYVEAGYAPANVTSYPYVVYEGRTVYHVHDDWYAHDGQGWVRHAAPPAYVVTRQSAPRAYSPRVIYSPRHGHGHERGYGRQSAPRARGHHDDDRRPHGRWGR